MQNYNFIQRKLHDLLLSNNFFKKSFFEIEKLIFLKNFNLIKEQKHIFITGLPRSSTTALLYFLYSTNRFTSLTYRNMPFIMSPNISNLLQKKFNIKKKERLHKDGITFDLDSPEAFDEVFFSTYNDDEIKEELTNYINLVLLNKNNKKYLSKNNSIYKRINLIQSILPYSTFLILLREPLQQANSLLTKHLHFSKLQKENDFIKRYMKYLGHNEFGLNHISWNKPEKFTNYNDINYWLEQWLKFYKNIYEKYKINNNCLFIKIEKFQNQETIENLLNKLNLNTKKKFQFKINKKNITEKYDTNLYNSAINLYNRINF
tara:strand:+ start:2314 stop:3267 length:954 start_codon:yes stop_codon:yes gene_type:complete